MPNGHSDMRDEVWSRSSFWGLIWSIGDACYYISLISTILAPLLMLSTAVRNFESREKLGVNFAIAFVLFVSIFPVGLMISSNFKRLARHYTGGSIR